MPSIHPLPRQSQRTTVLLVVAVVAVVAVVLVSPHLVIKRYLSLPPYPYRPGIPSPRQAPPRPTPRHSHSALFPPGQLPPLEPRPSVSVILPSFNTLESIIRRRSRSPAPHDSNRMIPRHSQNSPISSGPLPKPWKPEHMVIDQPSACSTLAGQQLNVPAPTLPPGYPG